MIRSTILNPRLLGLAPPQLNSPVVTISTVGRCPTNPTLLIAISDDSGSITAPGGADPISGRYREMEAALRAISKSCRCRQELAAVLHFDTPAGDAGPTPLSKTGLTSLMPALCIPEGSYGTSDLLPAMLRANEIADDHPEHQAVLVIFSDFFLTDAEPTAVSAAVGAFPGTVYACVLGGHAVQMTGIDHQIPVEHTSPPGAVAGALLAGLTHHRRPEAERKGLSRRVFHNALVRITPHARDPRPTPTATYAPGGAPTSPPTGAHMAKPSPMSLSRERTSTDPTQHQHHEMKGETP
ncbi:Uncharacterised protein [Mycobacteroides abscessus]|uniref:hypothetical protein n=1 Tax=Mycobacteroides abscessus TaxID=36809 RepID=UPI0005DDCD51|nr:hypothetical protein [Mycobacteroides abscessus]CPR39610.1 Uncharacterised protein [Mycobacteroides abscessus]CPR91387.1 Uncharacterised protein [Mycobacteroides abscessus]CPR95720.1 Uncharacterised protein [Mycobacteroides abscessus]CPS19337.1 Uncharacterised protein [Mycobacteroides abscessus]CPS41302.1 Uncharacterised protein [Mycobacteroides abscessus]